MGQEKAPFWFIALFVGFLSILIICDILNMFIAFLLLGVSVIGLRNPAEDPISFWILCVIFFAMLVVGEVLMTILIIKKRELESQIWNLVGAFHRFEWIILGILFSLPIFLFHDAKFWSFKWSVQLLIVSIIGSIFLVNIPLFLFHCALCNAGVRKSLKKLDEEVFTLYKTLP